jgi:hypothetical protein
MLGARPHTLSDSNGKFRIIDFRIGTRLGFRTRELRIRR